MTQIISSVEFSKMGGLWLGNAKYGGYNTICDDKGGTIGHEFEYEGYRYTRINLNWVEENGKEWTYSYIKEPLC